MFAPVEILRLPLRLLPDAVHARLLAAGANHLLRGQPLAARLWELEGRSFCLAITDADTRLHFCVRAGRLVPAPNETTDVVIRGNVQDFLDLARRAEDPDTLFFQRRLCLEGDTEVGLHVKNILDALHYDWEAHLRAVLPAPLAQAALGLARQLQGLFFALLTRRTPRSPR